MEPMEPCPLCGQPKLDATGTEPWRGWACRDCRTAHGLCFWCGEPAVDEDLLFCLIHLARENEEAVLCGEYDGQ